MKKQKYTTVNNHSLRSRVAVTPTRKPLSNVSKTRNTVLVTMFLCSLSGFLLLAPDVQSVPQSELEQTTVSAQSSQKLDFTELESTVDQIITDNPSLSIGVSVVDLASGEAKNYGEQDAFVAASTAKLLTAISFLHDVEEGTFSLDDTIGSTSAYDALEAMIVQSDNAAWYSLNNTAMSHQELGNYAHSIGVSSYDPDTNTVSPSDVAILLRKLYQRELLNDEHTNLLLTLMQRAENVPYIVDALPDSYTIYRKPGYLADRLNDAAIIDTGTRAYVLVIFSKSVTGEYDFSQGEALFSKIASKSANVFSHN